MSAEEYEETIRDLQDELSGANDVIAEWKDMHETATKRVTQLEAALETVKADAIYTIDRAL